MESAIDAPGPISRTLLDTTSLHPRIRRASHISLHKRLQEELGHDHILMPRQVDAENVTMDRLDRNPDPRLEIPNLHIRLIHEECIDPLHLEYVMRRHISGPTSLLPFATS